MVYDNFIKLAQQQDPRNKFEQCDTDLSFVPEPLRSFFNLHNPVDVEIVLNNLNSIRFSPVKYLMQLQNEYALDNSFIFATQEGDPIYYKDNGIFICAHGTDMKQDSKITASFDAYIEMLTTEMLKKD